MSDTNLPNPELTTAALTSLKILSEAYTREQQEKADLAAQNALLTGNLEASREAHHEAEECLKRAEAGKRESERALAAFRENVTRTLHEQGLRRLPGMEGYFADAPSLRACEAAAVFIFGNEREKQAYLRRRGWILTTTAWKDPQSQRDAYPLAPAVLAQVKRDVQSFQALLSSGVPEVPDDQPATQVNPEPTADRSAPDGGGEDRTSGEVRMEADRVSPAGDLADAYAGQVA